MTSLILRVQAAEHHFPSCRLARASYKPKSDTVRLEAAGVAFIVAPVCASKSALGQNQPSDSGMGQEGRSQIGELRFVPRCLSDKKLNNWIIGNRQRPLSDARAAANGNQSSIEIIRFVPSVQ